MSEEIDKDIETPPEEDEEIDDQSLEETESEPAEPTAKEAYELAQALQKGYTLTRQDIAAIRENHSQIQQALEEIKKGKDEYGGNEEEPLTVQKFLDLQTQQRQSKEQEDTRLNQQIDRQLDELRIQGVVKTEKDEQELLDFAVKRKITNLSEAAGRWGEIKEAKKEGMKEALKGRVKIDAGEKVGNSQRAGNKEQGFDYGEIHSKSMDELAAEG